MTLKELEKRETGGAIPVRLNVDQYHQMLEHGILQEGAPIELIDGMMVWKDRSSHDNPDFPGDHPPIVRLNVDQYHRMLEVGILQEGAPIELLDGLLVWKDRSKRGEDPMTVGHEHAWAVWELSRLGVLLEPHGCIVHAQQPMILDDGGEPEPDAVLVRGDRSTYRKRHPVAADALCVFEVSDSSLVYDRTKKQIAYANAGIPMYVIINLIGSSIEVRTNPQIGKGRYANITTLRAGENLSLPTADGMNLEVPVASMLP